MKNQNVKHRENVSAKYERVHQHLLITDLTKERDVKLPREMREFYRSKGAKFTMDLKTLKFTPGKSVEVSENLPGGKWGNFRKGIVVGDYPSFVQINYGTSWNNVCYLKKDILIGQVRIERQDDRQDGYKTKLRVISTC